MTGPEAPRAGTRGGSQSFDAIIVGGGVMGLGTAFRLARAGMRRVVVLEKAYLGQGSTGRASGGVRQQWGSRENIGLAQESVRLWHGLSKELGFNVLFRQGGYFFLIYDEAKLPAIERVIALQHAMGVPTRLLEVEAARRVVPELDYRGVVRAAFCPEDGHVFPFAVVWGYQQALARLGVPIWNGTAVTRFLVDDGRIEGVETTGGRFLARRVLVAAGVDAPGLLAPLGVPLPIELQRSQLLVTEPLRAFLDPMVIDTRNGMNFYQTSRGEIVLGVRDRAVQERPTTVSTLGFLEGAAAIVTLLPQLRRVRVMRQWAGCHDVSPDHKPILDRVPGIDGLFVACGFSGHGLMISPLVTRLLAAMIAGDRPACDLRPFRLGRFEEGDWEKDLATTMWGAPPAALRR